MRGYNQPMKYSRLIMWVVLAVALVNLIVFPIAAYYDGWEKEGYEYYLAPALMNTLVILFIASIAALVGIGIYHLIKRMIAAGRKKGNGTMSSGRTVAVSLVSVLVIVVGLAVVGVAGFVVALTKYHEGFWRGSTYYEAPFISFGTLDEYHWAGPYLIRKRISSLESADPAGIKQVDEPLDISTATVAKPAGGKVTFAKPHPVFEPPEATGAMDDTYAKKRNLPTVAEAQTILDQQVGVAPGDIIPHSPYAIVEIKRSKSAVAQVFAQYDRGKWVVLAVPPYTQKCRPGYFTWERDNTPYEDVLKGGGNPNVEQGTYPGLLVLQCKSVSQKYPKDYNLQSYDGGRGWTIMDGK